MSTAHRPTWDPSHAKDIKSGSRQYSTRDIASQTKLKFRQPGQTSTDEVRRRDLRAELLAAETEAREKKRKFEGKPALQPEGQRQIVAPGGSDDESNKRRKVLQDVIALDRDDDEMETNEASGPKLDADAASDDEEEQTDNEDEDEDEDEDDTAELLRELEKIKRERVEEKAKQEQEQAKLSEADREAQVATANPLLNLAAALGQKPAGTSTIGGSFAVKRRWDDDLVFKNQAVKEQPRPTHFVNDLLRTEFHKKFMTKFIK